VTSSGDAPETGADAATRLRHDLKTPLTTILARSQLVARWTARSPTLGEAERSRTLASLAAIDAAVAQLLVVIDAIGGDTAGGSEPDG
jgi:signal transduction histidine kinase